MADRQRLQQVLLNLLSNARQVQPSRGRRDRLVRGRLRGPVPYHRCRLGARHRTGRMHRLFTPFDRLDVPDGAVEGTGLGLALSKGLVELMGGTLRGRSTLGVGSAFSLELPVATTPVCDVACAGGERARRRRGERGGIGAVHRGQSGESAAGRAHRHAAARREAPLRGAGPPGPRAGACASAGCHRPGSASAGHQWAGGARRAESGSWDARDPGR